MTNTVKITEEQGEELTELEYSKGSTAIVEGREYTYFDMEENVEEHRWNTTDLYVFERDDGKLFGMLYDVGATESQESGFIYNNPELYEVTRKEKTVVTYQEVK